MIAALFLALVAPSDPPRQEVSQAGARQVLLGDDSLAGQAPLALVWPGAVALMVERDATETVVRFDRALPDAAIDAFRRAAGDDLARLNWNDDTLVLASAQGRTMIVEPMRDRLLVRFAAAVAVADSVADDGALERELAIAAADSASGYPGRARRRLAAMDGADPRVARALADLDVAQGMRGRAARRYRDLGAGDPMAAAAMRDSGGEAQVAGLYRSGSGFSQGEATARLSLPIGDATMLSAAARHADTRADAVVGREAIRRDVAVGRTLGEISVQTAPGATLRFDIAAVFDFTDPMVGFAGRMFVGSAEREVRLLAAWRQPDVSTAEAALLGGRVDRLGGGIGLRLGPAVSLSGDVAWNGYGLAGEGLRATSITLAAGVDYIVRRREPTLSLLYRLDAEYVDRLDLRGFGPAALPLIDRENHTVQALVGQSLGNIRLAAAGGWTFDRFGGDGPTAALTAAALLPDGWRADLGAGVSSVSRPNLPGTQLFVRGALARALGRP